MGIKHMNAEPVRILELEDNTGDYFLVKQLLQEREEQFPFVLERREYLATALQLLSEQAFDLVLCDLHVPDSRGLETMVNMHRHAGNVPVIVLTSIDDESLAMQAMHHGAQDYLVKGQFDSQLLVRAIRYAIERKRNEVAHHLLEVKLQKAQRLEAIGRFAGGIAHNFNNILHAIAGYAQLLTMSGNASEEVTTYSNHIVNATFRASELVKKMLNFSRQQEIRSVPVDLHELIKEAVGMLRPIVGARINLVCQLDAPQAIIEGDADALVTALLNLGMNATDAIPQDGQLIFTTTTASIRDPLSPSDVAVPMQKQCCILSITDTGCGMDRETLELLFEPFFTTKEPGKGVGLGLADVYGCIRQHNGDITADSTPGKGTTFTITLPLASSHTLADAAATPPPLPTIGVTTGKILVVDDEEWVRETLSEMLKLLEYKCQSCVDGLEAVEYFKVHHDELQAVFLDVMMPRLNGVETLKQLRLIDAKVPVIMATGYCGNEQEIAELKRMADGYLDKPYSLDQLARMLSDVLGRRRS